MDVYPSTSCFHINTEGQKQGSWKEGRCSFLHSNKLLEINLIILIKERTNLRQKYWSKTSEG